ncbi:MAG: thioredoxin family protein [Methyloligellaceae bacterium]
MRSRLMNRGRLALVSAALGMALFMVAPGARAEPKIGVPSPDFAGVDTAGKTHKLSDLRGKTVVLEWTNHQCPFVGKHYGTDNMQALQKRAKGDGVVWLSIISSAPGLQGYVKPAQADELTKTRGAAPSAVILDPKGTIGRLYGATTTPHMFVIDPSGALVYKGAIDDRPTARHRDVDGAKNYVREALKALAAGGKINPAATRAYGCSVKYGS